MSIINNEKILKSVEIENNINIENNEENNINDDEIDISIFQNISDFQLNNPNQLSFLNGKLFS
jgi:hypothetical protein